MQSCLSGSDWFFVVFVLWMPPEPLHTAYAGCTVLAASSFVPWRFDRIVCTPQAQGVGSAGSGGRGELGANPVAVGPCGVWRVAVVASGPLRWPR